MALLEVKDVHKRFGGTYAARGVSFVLGEGEVLALAGDNGAGKSTLIKIISGVHQPDSGEVSYKGRSIRGRTPQEVREVGIETIYQDLALADNLDVGINLFLGREKMTRFLGRSGARPQNHARGGETGALRPRHRRRGDEPPGA